MAMDPEMKAEFTFIRGEFAKLYGYIDAVKTVLTERIDAVESSLTELIDGLARSTASEFAVVHAKLNILDERTELLDERTERIERKSDSLQNQIDTIAAHKADAIEVRKLAAQVRNLQRP